MSPVLRRSRRRRRECRVSLDNRATLRVPCVSGKGVSITSGATTSSWRPQRKSLTVRAIARGCSRSFSSLRTRPVATASSSLIFSSIVLSRSKASAVALLTVVGMPSPAAAAAASSQAAVQTPLPAPARNSRRPARFRGGPSGHQPASADHLDQPLTPLPPDVGSPLTPSRRRSG